MSRSAQTGDDGLFDFQPEVEPGTEGGEVGLTVLSVDDDASFQRSLRMALEGFRFQEQPVRLITAGSAAEAERLLAQTPDVSAMLLDVVMETDDAGLRLVRSVREQLGNAEVRIVLVTGQPGTAPRQQTLEQLDISEYWLKTDLYRERLQGILTGNLRTWREIHALGRAKRGLQQIVQAGHQLAGLRDLHAYSQHMLHELAQLLQVQPEGLVCVRADGPAAPPLQARLVGAGGRFAELLMQCLQDVDDPLVRRLLVEALTRHDSIETPESQVLFFDGGELAPPAAVYLATGRLLDAEERELLRVFATHANAGLVNVDLAARLDRIAYQDSLLGIPNGNALQRDLASLLAEPTPRGSSVMFLELDQYAQSSLTLGPEQGDLLLLQMADRLRGLYPAPCRIARLHDGVFAVLGPRTMLGEEPFAALGHEGGEMPLPLLGIRGALVELDVYDGTARGAIDAGLTLLRRAHAIGAHALQRYDATMEHEHGQRFLLSRALYRAVQAGRIEIALQAQVSLEHGRIIGAEALARWTGDDGRPVSPAEFIPVAEASGLIVPLGQQVVEQACQALRAMADAGFPGLTLAVNVSPLQLRRREFADELAAVLARHGIAPAQLEIEITEQAVMSDFQDGREMLHRLRAMGFPVAVDDFGTGYSSLRYVQSLPVTRLKLDRDFTDEIGSGSRERSVADMIVALGRRLGLEVLAEGVETHAQAEWLRAHGCHSAQGFLFARPEPLAAFIARLHDQAGGR